MTWLAVATAVSMEATKEYATAVRSGILVVVWMAACWVDQKV